MIDFLTKMRTSFFIIFLIPFVVGGCQTQQEETRPNIILIMTDDQGYGDVGFHGNPQVQTPVLDSLARLSTRFTRFYVNPVCAPSRAALMTGKYALRAGVYDTFNGGAILGTEQLTIAEILKDNGYRTGIFGKWHLGDNYPFRPGDQGFTESLVHGGGGMGQPGDHIHNLLRSDSSYFDPVLYRNGREEEYRGYCSDIFTAAAMEFIDQTLDGGDDPFFLYLSFNAPHVPLQVPMRYLDLYEEMEITPGHYPVTENFPEMDEDGLDAARRVFAMITNIDDNIGLLVDHLTEKGITENTLFIFMTDNGPQQYRYNGGFRGKKGSVYEGGIRVPCFMNWEGRFDAGKEIAVPAAHIDILPTLLEVCGIPVRPGMDLDGMSLLPLIEGDLVSPDNRTLFHEWARGYIQPYRNVAVNRGRYKLVGNSDPGEGRSALELYDLEADPWETNDLSDRHPEIVEELASAFDDWYGEVIACEALTDPPRIILGSEHENPSVLTRQDWKGAKNIPWRSRDALGYWDVSFPEDGFFDVKLIHAGTVGRAGTAHVRAGTIQRSVVNRDTTASTIILEDVPFRKGDYMLEAWYHTGGEIWSPLYVEITRKPEEEVVYR